MTKTLTGKVALVTGGSRGIGAATARALAEDGADVAISYAVSVDKAEKIVRELEGKGVRAATFRTNHAESAPVEELVRAVVERFGHLDILVNNAGVFITGTVDNPENDIAAFKRQYTINFESVATAIRAAAKVMENGGRIITVGSSVGTRAGFAGVADYTATKAAIVGYSRGAARDLAPRNITVNVLQAGAVDTDMNPATGDFASAWNATVALGRYARPEEIAAGISHYSAILSIPALPPFCPSGPPDSRRHNPG